MGTIQLSHTNGIETDPARSAQRATDSDRKEGPRSGSAGGGCMVEGGMGDYNYMHHGCLEFTIEVIYS